MKDCQSDRVFSRAIVMKAPVATHIFLNNLGTKEIQW